MATRFVDEEQLFALLRQGPGEGPARGKFLEKVQRWMERQRTAPRLVGATKAADMLGIHTPHLSRLREQGRMPDPIPVEGSKNVYLYEEVAALAEELKGERRERLKKRARSRAGKEE